MSYDLRRELAKRIREGRAYRADDGYKNAVECPICGAPPGYLCMRRDGEPKAPTSHRERRETTR